MLYWTCPNCGANLDAGERCDCREEPAHKKEPPDPHCNASEGVRRSVDRPIITATSALYTSRKQ